MRECNNEPAATPDHGCTEVANQTAPIPELVFESVFDSLREGVTVTDGQASIVWVNRACCDISGYTKQELVGATPRVFNSGRQSRRYFDAMWLALREKGCWSGEIWNRHKNGEIYPQWLSIAAMQGRDGCVENYVSVFSDIAMRKHAEDRMLRLSHFDVLTGLPNRALFFDRLQQALARARHHKSRVSLFVVDLDHFKSINSNFGHGQGDQVLIQAAQRLTSCLGQTDSIARLSGDEFALILGLAAGGVEVANVARKIIAAIDAPFHVGGHVHQLGASIGIATFPEDGEDEETLLRRGGAALYLAKQAGRGTYQQVSSDQRRQVERDALLQSQLPTALATGQFFLMYQPQVATHDGRLVGLEALLRWRLPDGTLVPPGRFIPLAERSGAISAIDRHVIELGSRQIADWMRAGLSMVPVSFNLSADSFRKAGLAMETVDLLHEKGIGPHSMIMEVTETAAMANLSHTIGSLEAWRALGIGVAIDNVGSDSSSLNYLRQFPANSLRIDQRFIRNIDESSADRALVRSLLELARTLGLKIVAKGVEMGSQYDFLRDHGCDVIQGYLYSPPITAAQAAIMLQHRDAPVARAPSAG